MSRRTVCRNIFSCREAVNRFVTLLSAFLLLGALLLLSGCALFQPSVDKDSKGVRYSESISIDPSLVEEKTLDREEYNEAFASPNAINKARLIQVFSRRPGAPEYRVFDVRQGDPFYQLGLREGDVLLAANDFLIFDIDRFRAFVNLARAANATELLVRRKGKVVLLKRLLVPALPETPERGRG